MPAAVQADLCAPPGPIDSTACAARPRNAAPSSAPVAKTDEVAGNAAGVARPSERKNEPPAR